MSLSILNVRTANPDEWDTIWRECEYSTYFHSREWSEIWNAYTDGQMRPEPKLVVFSDNKKALLPLSSLKNYKGFVAIHISSPAGTLGGWLSTDDLSVSHVYLLINYLTRKFRNLVWRLNPYDRLISKAGLEFGEKEETYMLNLLEGFDAIHNHWTKGQRSAARKAFRSGVSVKLASQLDEWRTYYQAYEASLRRWGNKVSSEYGWEIFEEMSARQSPYIKLWLAFYQHRIISGALCFYSKHHVVYWHGASLEEYFYLRPVNLLMYEAIKDACEKGYTWFDFNPSGGHEGVKAFKKSFGPKPLYCPVVRTETSALRLLKTLRSFISCDYILP
jgi:hypothetical protein